MLYVIYLGLPEQPAVDAELPSPPNDLPPPLFNTQLQQQVAEETAHVPVPAFIEPETTPVPTETTSVVELPPRDELPVEHVEAMDVGDSALLPHEPYHHEQPIQHGDVSEEIPPLVDASAVPVDCVEQAHHEEYVHHEEADVSSFVEDC